jgi:hypothetical protein
MSHTTTRRVVSALACAAAATLAAVHLGAGAPAASAARSTAAPAAATTTFADATGDARGALDIEHVTVTVSRLRWIVVQATFANAPSSLPADAGIFLDVDADRNPQTGALSHAGADYIFELVGSQLSGPGQDGFEEEGWSSGAFTPTADALSAARYANGVATFTFPRSAIGWSTGFDFYLDTQVGWGAHPHAFDLAPAGDTWRVEIGGTPHLTLGRTSWEPARAGEPWMVMLEPISSDGDRDPLAGRLSCKAAVVAGSPSVGGLGIRVLGGGSPMVGCAFDVPQDARGSRIIGTVTLWYDGSSVQHTFTAIVR